MRASWLIAAEYLRRTFTSKSLVLVILVAVIFLIVGGCLFGGDFNVQGQDLAPADQLGLARAVSYHFATAWAIFFAVMLGASAVARPLEDGRTAILLSKPLSRARVLIGQAGGAFLAAAINAGFILVLATALHLLAGGGVAYRLWAAFPLALLAVAVASTFATLASLFLPRVVAAMLGVILYLASVPAAFPKLRDFIAGDASRMLGMHIPWYVRWGTEIYFALCPPLAGAEFRGADIVAARPFTFDAWLTLATAGVYVVVFAVAAWAVFSRKDL